jgi:hypothetical protein
MSILNKLTKDLIDKIIIEIKMPENQEKINYEIINPILNTIIRHIKEQLYPILIFGSIIFILTFIFAFIIMILIIKLNLK